MSLFGTKKIDWAVRSTFEATFPAYRREQIRLDQAGVARSKAVDIRNFNLKNPYGSADIFIKTSLTIQPNKRCAVFGVNGSGKTCLFEAISSGKIADFPNHLLVHHMKELEHDEAKDAMSVLDTVLASHPYRNALLKCEKGINQALVESKDDAERTKILKSNLDYVVQQLGTVHGDNATHAATSMLRVLGFDEVGEKAPLSSLSGGLRMRVALACSFFVNADLLLLDEPTNHLDLPSVLWLENKLRSYKESFLLVTHDRTLLENIVHSVMEISEFKLINYPTDFKQFEIEKEKKDKAKEKTIEYFLSRNQNLPFDSPKIKTKLAYEKWIETREERKTMLQGKFTFSNCPALELPEGVTDQKEISLIKIDNLRFSYDPTKLPFIFDEPISYDIKVGTRVGIMGPNGAGKSTLLKLVTGKLEPTDGTIARYPNGFKTAYFGQHSTKELDLNKSAMDFMKWKFPKANVGTLRSHLAKTSVGDSIVETRMKNLSFSQRSCVIFAALTFVPPHLLIMDEPTNFLDLDSVDSLIKAVNKFRGGLVVVTHNRDFLKRTVKTFLSIIPGAFLEFETMKQAERATYSFITALENGEHVDAKSAILQNRGGGAVHSDKDQAQRKAALSLQQRRADNAAAKIEAERLEAERIKAEKDAKIKAKIDALKTDWVAGEKCFIVIKGKWTPVEVVRVNPMGVSCRTPSGTITMVDAVKCRAENPDAGAGSSQGRGGKKGGRGRGGRGGRGGGRGGGNKSVANQQKSNGDMAGGAKRGRGAARSGSRGGVSKSRGGNSKRGGARGGAAGAGGSARGRGSGASRGVAHGAGRGAARGSGGGGKR